MPFIKLNRQFCVWHDDKASHEDFQLFAKSFHGDAGWLELLKYQRVVLLAEAGSGKSRELAEQAKALETAGEFAFHATVQNVAKVGLLDALGHRATAQFEAWHQSGKTAWFLIDSIDEAKLDHIRLSEALRRLKDAIGDALPRARIILSGRYASWEFRTDLGLLDSILPVAVPKPDLPEDDRHPLVQLIRANDRGTRGEKEPEKPLIVLMAPLDRERVKTFAIGQGVENAEAFAASLDEAGLWDLAQRPLDLSWLIEYWRKHKRFGRLVQMLETSLRERLRETDANRALRDPVNPDRAFAALERIGAATVFGREARIEVPDSSLNFSGTTPALGLQEILPDWHGEQLAWLRDRPVFDPASLGRLKLHNDNQGIVSGFLAARWLAQRLAANAPASRVRALLFAEADGVPIVLPSAQETVAWLAIWSNEIAREVIRRDPALLLTAGDPGSLSVALRADALQGLTAQLAAGEQRHGMLDHATLHRFATPDLAPAIMQAWDQRQNHAEVRKLLLTLIDVGELKDCIAIAREAASGRFRDRTTLLYSVRAVAAAGSDADIRSQVEDLKAGWTEADQTLLWEWLDLFFPKYLAVDYLLAVVAQNERSPEAARDFGWRAQNVIKRLESRVDLEKLLQGLLQEAGATIRRPDAAAEETAKDKRLAPLIEGAALRLLELTPVRAANAIVINAAIWLSAGHYNRVRRFKDESFQDLLCASPERRRAGLWQAVEKLKDHPKVTRSGGLTNLSQLQFAGWDAGLTAEDFGWLIEDAHSAATPAGRQIAIDGVLDLWRGMGSPEAALGDIRAAAALDAETAAQLEARLAPRKLSPEEVKMRRQLAGTQKRRAKAEEKADASWVDFVDGLKADPKQLRSPPPDLKPGFVDGRLYHIWRLLQDALPDRTSYAIGDFDAFKEIFGPELTHEAEAAFVRFWRDRPPTLISSRKPDARNQVNQFDCMGLVGITLEVKYDPGWAPRLSEAEATTAAQLATLELNGFPVWLGALATAWPDQVRHVFLQEAEDHIAVDAGQHGFIDKVNYADAKLAALLAPAMMRYVTDHTELPQKALGKALELVIRAHTVAAIPPAFIDLAMERFTATGDAGVGALYLAIGFHADPRRAIEALTRKLDALEWLAQKLLTEHLLPVLFGDRLFQEGIGPAILPLAALERLTSIAFKTIRLEEDNVHDGVFSHNRRDHAEGARGSLLQQLRMTPGRPTIEALKRLKADPDFPIPAERMSGLILERAATDAEAEPWPPAEAYQMEQEFDTAPRTPRDLQVVALQRLADIDHDLHHAEFAQGQTVKALPNEREMQKWVAAELKHRKGRAYTLTREPHVVEEKEPDIRFQANATDASMPIEIKVAESWTLTDLREALATQLTGRYLRERDKRHGVLLLVHQNARPRGWEDEASNFLSFVEVVARLRSDAAALGTGEVDPSHAVIAVIDVSDIETASPGRRRE